MSNENINPEEAQPEEKIQQQLIPEEEVKDTIKPSTRAIRLATVSRLLDKYASQLDKMDQKFQPLQTQMDRISKLIQPIQKQLKTIEKQTDLIKQMQSQLRQVQRDNQKIKALLLSEKKKNFSTARNRYNKRRESGIRRPR